MNGSTGTAGQCDFILFLKEMSNQTMKGNGRNKLATKPKSLIRKDTHMQDSII